MSCTIEHLANCSAEYDLFVHYSRVGACSFHQSTSTLPTEVIHILDSPRCDHGSVECKGQIVQHGLEDYMQSSWFQEVQPIIETLQDDTPLKNHQLLFVNPRNGMHTGISCNKAKLSAWILEQDLHTKCTVNTVEAIGCTSFVFPKNLPHEAVVCIAKFIDDALLRPAILNQQPGRDGVIVIDHTATTISQRNGLRVPRDEDRALTIHSGDFVLCKPLILAGGHHSTIPPPSLAADSNVDARIEFLVNTHGWLATDEMYAYTQTLTWTQEVLKFSPPLLWDIGKNELDETMFGEATIYNNSTTVLPILVQAHWGAVEIRRQGDQAFLTLVQIPNGLQNRLVFIIARMLDISSHRLHIHVEPEYFAPHLCGWHLLMRWFSRDGSHLQPADHVPQPPLPQNYIYAIGLAIQSSQEEWRSAGATAEVITMATRLRRQFLIHLATRESQGQPVQQYALQVSVPPGGARFIVAGPPLDLNPDQPRLDRINQRLQHFLRYGGWMGSDELDYMLEGPRALSADSLFCAPAMWTSPRHELPFLNAMVPSYEALRHIVWPVAINNHWVLVEAMRFDSYVDFSITAPPSLQPELQPLVAQLVSDMHLENSVLQVTYIPQNSPPHMCGYDILRRIFSRLDATSVAINDTQRATDYLPLLQFAVETRDWFLARVIENRFPDHYIAAGVETSDVDRQDSSKKSKTNPTPPSKGSGSSDARDPWLSFDPWKTKPPRPAQAKWEDLLLQAPLPFIGTTGSPLPQTHRIQANQKRG